MTLTTTHNRISYTGDGILTTYPYTFLITVEADLLVYLDGVLQVSGYSITGEGSGAGGNVIFATAPANGVDIDLVRATDPTQQVNLIEGDRLPAEAVEGMFDKVYALCQDLAERIRRAVKVPLTSASAGVELDLPDPAVPANQNKALFINGSGLLEPRSILSTDIASPIVAKGDLIQGADDGTPEKLAVGTTGQVLTVAGGKAAWQSAAIPPSVIDAKGDLIVGTAADTAARKAVGADGTVLAASAAQADGLAWTNPALLLGAFARAANLLLTNTTTETTLLSTTITAPLLSGAGRALRLGWHGNFANNVGTNQGITFRVKLGGVTILTLATGTIASSVTSHGLAGQARWGSASFGAAAAWSATGHLILGNVGIGGTEVGEQVRGFSHSNSGSLGTLNLSANLTLEVTAQLSTASAALFHYLNDLTVELV